jgi:Beta-ketoacyl synthase, N-terminal domain
MQARTAYVHGLAFWASRLPGWELAAPVLRGESPAPVQPAPRPSPPTLAPTERRRAPDTVAIALVVAARACEHAGVDPRTLPSVFASTDGDLAINDYMSSTLATAPMQVSPIRFHNSVHNAAAGYWTIGTGCHEPYTALSAFEDTFGEGLLEALSQAACAERPVLYVAYDIEARGPLATIVPSRGIVGAALVVSPHAGARPFARIDWRTVRGTVRTQARPRNADLIGEHSMAGCLPLFEALACGERRTIRCGLSPSFLLETDVSVCLVS